MISAQQLASIMHGVPISPVLVDIGASGATHPIWDTIAPHAIYIGFDPDLRKQVEVSDSPFKQAFMIDKAIIGQPDTTAVPFYLTQSPYCSSTLKPLANRVSEYIYTDFFNILSTTTVNTTTLDEALAVLDIDHPHWIKLDSQGIDLRILQSLPSSKLDRVLAIDIEPGLDHIYEAEDLFYETHLWLAAQGFWMSNADLRGTVRIKQSTLERFREFEPRLKQVKAAPVWIEARYLRSLDSLTPETTDYVLLWAFSILSEQYGYALDVAAKYEELFGDDSLSRQMVAVTLSLLPPNPDALAVWSLRRLVPKRVKRAVRILLIGQG